MTDRRSGDPHPDGLPEDVADSHPDSPPALRDDDARDDLENLARNDDALEGNAAHKSGEAE